jgi:hypothetical protein
MKPKKPLSFTGSAADTARIVRAWKQAAGDLSSLAAKVEHVATVWRVEHGEPAALEGDAELARIDHVIYRNGTSTLQFGYGGGGASISGAMRMTAVRLK